MKCNTSCKLQMPSAVRPSALPEDR